MARVVTSEEAHQLVQQLQGDIVRSEGELETMLRTGEALAQPGIWEGAAANRFKGETWPSAAATIRSTVEQLKALQLEVNRINQDITGAGGGLG